MGRVNRTAKRVRYCGAGIGLVVMAWSLFAFPLHLLLAHGAETTCPACCVSPDGVSLVQQEDRAQQGVASCSLCAFFNDQLNHMADTVGGSALPKYPFSEAVFAFAAPIPRRQINVSCHPRAPPVL